MSYQRPETLDEILSLLAGDKWLILAGGTDINPAQVDRPPPENILDITAVDSLQNIHLDGNYWHLGAGVTWNDLHGSALPNAFNGLRQAAREIGAIQIQNSATIVGNICNASPAADGMPPLLTLDAEIILQSVNGKRNLPLGDFILGNRHTALADDELATGIRVPVSVCNGNSQFIKLGARKYLVISIAMVAARLVVDAENKISEVAIAVGACSEVARRLPGLEDKLQHQAADIDLSRMIQPDDFAGLSPIDDVRADKAYRLDAACEITRRALRACLKDRDSVRHP